MVGTNAGLTCVILVVLVVVSVVSPVFGKECPDPYKRSGDLCSHLAVTADNFDAAQRECSFLFEGELLSTTRRRDLASIAGKHMIGRPDRQAKSLIGVKCDKDKCFDPRGNAIKREIFNIQSGREDGCVVLLPPRWSKAVLVDCQEAVPQFVCTVGPRLEAETYGIITNRKRFSPTMQPCRYYQEKHDLSEPMTAYTYVDIDIDYQGENPKFNLKDGKNILLHFNPRGHGLGRWTSDDVLVLDSKIRRWRQAIFLPRPSSLQEPGSIRLRFYHLGDGHYVGYVNGKLEFAFTSRTKGDPTSLQVCVSKVTKLHKVMHGKPVEPM